MTEGFLGSFQLLLRTPDYLEVTCGSPTFEAHLLSSKSPSVLPSLDPKLEKERFSWSSLEGAGNVTFGAGQGWAGPVGGSCLAPSESAGGSSGSLLW